MDEIIIAAKDINRIRFPNRCPCCGDKPDNNMEFGFRMESGFNIYGIQVNVPYCSTCLLHIKGLPNDAKPFFHSLSQVMMLYVIALMATITLLVVINSPLWWILPIYLVEVVLLSYLLLPRYLRDRKKYLARLDSLRKQSCCCMGSAAIIDYDDWKQKLSLRFRAPDYSIDFLHLNNSIIVRQ
jgi:hypothetical protein